MGNGRGIWDQYHRDSICDKGDIIVSLNKSIDKLKESNKPTSIFDYLFKSSFRKKQKKINQEIQELEDRIKGLRKSIKSDEMEMYD